MIINTHQFVDFNSLNMFADDLEEARKLYEIFFAKGVGFINRAKKAHDILESYYGPNTDFGKLDILFRNILKRIMEYSIK